MKKLIWIICLTIGLLTQQVIALPVQPSFDCANAENATDKLVCSDSELATLDNTLAAAYAAAKLTHPENAEQLKHAQRLWLTHDRNLDRCKHDNDSVAKPQSNQIACLRAIYQQRITSLGNQTYLLPLKTQTYLTQLTNAQFQKLSANQQDNFACPLFKIKPEAAYNLYFSVSPMTVGGDALAPMCREGTIINKVPDMQLLQNILVPILGESPSQDCTGHGLNGSSIRYMDREFTVILAATDPYPAIDDATSAQEVEISHYLALWAQQGNWQKKQYAALQNSIAKVTPKLENYYMQTFHVDKPQASAAAAYYIGQLIWTYMDATDVTALTSSSPAADLTTSDLDAYLKHGQLPSPTIDSNTSPVDLGQGMGNYAESTDQSKLSKNLYVTKPVLLRRLLSLAIINYYPTTVVQQLITAGADVNVAPTKNNKTYTRIDTPLMLAAARPDVIQLLLHAGANPNSQNWFGKSALMYAIQEQDLDGINLLIKQGANVNLATALQSANWDWQDTDKPEADFDLICSNITAGRRTALMYAAWQGTADIIQLLVAAHADIHAKDTNGHTAYDYLDKNKVLNATQRQAMQTLLK